MADNTIQKLMEKHGFNTADISFIINYMAKENLSPQLIMRRIKSYEALEKKLKTKLDADRKKVEHLEKELEIKTKTLEEANKKLEELGQAIQKEDEIRASLETRSEILDAELEELRNQLQMIQVMQVEEPAKKSPEAEEITKSINHIINEIKLLIVEYEEVTTLFLPIVTALTEALANPEEFVFNPEDLANAIEDFKLMMELGGGDSAKLSTSPVESATGTPSPVTSPAPSPVTSPAPSPVTSPAPSPVTSPAPSPVTSPAPSPVTSPAPSPVTSPAPSPVTSPAPSPVRSSQPEPTGSDTEDVVPTWERIEHKEEVEEEKAPMINPKEVIQRSKEQIVGDDDEKEEEPPEEKEESVPTDRPLTPSEIIKQRQKALAEREARRAAELAEIEAIKRAAMEKAAAADKKKEERREEKKVEEVTPEPVKEAVVTIPPEPKPAAPPKEEKKVEEKKKEVKEEPAKQKTDDKTTLVLRTFQDFINEAKTTKNFNERIKLICDQDAAYEVLGSIGVSQLYSYVTRPVEMKKEVIDLIESWIQNGTP